MEKFETAVLGVVQGITEFLPISSTAHLMIFSWLLSWRDAGLDLAVWLHSGTLLAIIVYFRKDWAAIAAALYRSCLSGSFEDSGAKMGAGLVITTLPVIVFGVFFENVVAVALRHPLAVGWGLLAGSAVLFIADRKSGKTKHLSELSLKDCLLFGVAQSFALVPGVSRSGISIAGGMFLGYTREDSAKFAFMMGMPAIVAAIAHTVWKNGMQFHYDGDNITGILTAAATGFLAIRFLLNFARKKSYTPFVIYRIAIAALLFFMFFSGGGSSRFELP